MQAPPVPAGHGPGGPPPRHDLAMDRRLAVRCEGLSRHSPHFELQDVDLAFEWGIVRGLVGPCLARTRFY
jgi:hypothetical protein